MHFTAIFRKSKQVQNFNQKKNLSRSNVTEDQVKKYKTKNNLLLQIVNSGNPQVGRAFLNLDPVEF